MQQLNALNLFIYTLYFMNVIFACIPLQNIQINTSIDAKFVAIFYAILL